MEPSWPEHGGFFVFCN